MARPAKPVTARTCKRLGTANPTSRNACANVHACEMHGATLPKTLLCLFPLNSYLVWPAMRSTSCGLSGVSSAHFLQADAKDLAERCKRSGRTLFDKNFPGSEKHLRYLVYASAKFTETNSTDDASHLQGSTALAAGDAEQLLGSMFSAAPSIGGLSSAGNEAFYKEAGWGP